MFKTDLRDRRRQDEIMDGSGLDPAAHREALAALRRVNAFSDGVGALWPPIRDLARDRERRGDGRPLRVLDIATGGGDVPVALWRRARREGIALEVAGCDRSALAIAHAADQARRAGAEVDFYERDALAGPLPGGYDVFTSSLFLHHLDEPDAVAFLGAMRRGAELMLVDDLRRGLAGWALAYVGIRLLSRSAVARVDGPRSVEGAFTIDEARGLALRAGWADAQVRPHWPCRFLLSGRGEGASDRDAGR